LSAVLGAGVWRVKERQVARMEPTGRREAPPDDRLRAIRDKFSRARDSPGLRFAPSGLQLATHAASMRRKPFHIAVAAPEVSTGKMRVS